VSRLTSDEVDALRMAARNLPHLHMGTDVHPGAKLPPLHPARCAACARMVIEQLLERLRP
jgi:hypothetical protein